MYTLADRPQTIGEVLDGGFKLYFSGFKNVVLFSVIFAILWLVPSVVFNQSFQAGTSSFSVQDLVNVYLLIFAIGVISSVLMIAMIYRYHMMATDQQVSGGEALKHGFQRLVPFVVGSILYWIATLGGLIFFIIPGFILMVLLAFYSVAVTVDGDGPINGLNRSSKLVWGNWWRTLLIFTVIFVIYSVIYMGLALIAIVPAFLSAGSGPSVNNLYLDLGGVVINTVVYPFFAAMMVVQYNDLKLRKEGQDLEARINEAAL